MVRALQVERCDASLKVSLNNAPPVVSAARTQPIKPRAVLPGLLSDGLRQGEQRFALLQRGDFIGLALLLGVK